MQEKADSGVFVVHTPELASYFSQRMHAEELVHFSVDSGATIQSFAQARGLTMVQAYRKVQVLMKQGFLVVLNEQPRRGRPVRRYRSSYHTFLIPSTLLSVYDILEDRQQDARVRRALEQTTATLGVDGLRVSIEKNGDVHMILVDAHGAPINPFQADQVAMLWNSVSLSLDFEDAKALQQELSDIIDRYVGRSGSGRYLHYVILTPDTNR